MPDLRSFHAGVGRCWIDAHHGTQSQSETTLLDLGFLILEKLVATSDEPGNDPGDVLLAVAPDVHSYVILARSIFDPMRTPFPPSREQSE